MTDRNSAVGKGNNAEKAYDTRKRREGFRVIIRSTRTMKRIPNPDPKARHFRPFIFVQSIVDLGNSWDRIYVRDNEIEFAQICQRKHLADHKKRIEENFPVTFNIPGIRFTIPLWRKVKHGKSERYEFDIVEWVYSTDEGRMIWIERQERL